jgi:hypothetical protein
VFMSSRVISLVLVSLVLVMCQPFGLSARTVLLANQSPGRTAGVPTPAVDPTPGTWTYKVTGGQPDGAFAWNHAVTIKDDGGVWTVTYAQEISEGNVTLVQTLDKGTLILRKELFKHFAKPGDPGPFTINLDFTGNKVTGTTSRGGQDRPVAVDVGGPLFPGEAGSVVTMGCLPLADGYSTIFRYFDIQRQKERLLQLKVVGTERVTVPAGTFDSYRVESTSADGGAPIKETVWIARDSRTPVKVSASETVGSGTIVGTTELVR